MARVSNAKEMLVMSNYTQFESFLEPLFGFSAAPTH